MHKPVAIITVGFLLVAASCKSDSGHVYQPHPVVYPYEGEWNQSNELIYATRGGNAACGCRGCGCDPEFSRLIISSQRVRKSCGNVRGNGAIEPPRDWKKCVFEDRMVTCSDLLSEERQYELLRVTFSEDLRSAEVYLWLSTDIPPGEPFPMNQCQIFNKPFDIL